MTMTCALITFGRMEAEGKGDAIMAPQTEAQRRWRAANRDKINAYQRKYRGENVGQFRQYDWHRRHGISQEEFEAVWLAQDGLCYLCGEPMERGPERSKALAVIDHDHEFCPQNKHSCDRCRRGLTHLGCNVVIGNAGDDPEKLRRIADALEAAKRRLREGVVQ
jgi:hypothetical protein